MSINYRKIEKSKYKKSDLLLFFGFVFMVTMAFLSISLLSPQFRESINGSNHDWLSILDNYFFSKLIVHPIMLAALIGKSVDIENENNMWKVLYSTGIDFKKIYRVKFFYIFSRVVIFQILEWTALITYGKILGLMQPIALIRFGFYFTSQVSISFCLLAIHYLISLKWSNQLISTSVAILGSLTGIISFLLSKILTQLNPYSWYGSLFSIQYIPSGQEWIQVLYPLNLLTLPISLVLGGVVFIFGMRVKGEE